MQVLTTDEKDVIVIHLHGRITGVQDTDDFHNVIETILTSDFKNAVLDIKGVDWMNSTGLALLVRAYTQLHEAGCRMHIAGASPAVQTVLHTTKLDSVFGLFPNVAEAAADLRQTVA
ncbi:STAS domain-containing protein [candidate division KSB1 bacterium]|nr:STAS domain-containing protein [candidate division KSB1 bacterium]